MKGMEHGYSVHTYVYDANERGVPDASAKAKTTN